MKKKIGVIITTVGIIFGLTGCIDEGGEAKRVSHNLSQEADNLWV